MSDFAKTTALFRSINKQYECYSLQAVEISDEIIYVTLDIDTKSKEPHRVNLAVMLDSETEVLTMYTRVVFAVEPRHVSSILTVINNVQYSVFEKDSICYPIYLGPAPDGNHHNFYVMMNQHFSGQFVGNRPDEKTSKKCEKLLQLFLQGYIIIFNTLYCEFRTKERATSSKQMMN